MTVLKLAFAMGGGVSLGTFSGSALTEAIKLAVLNAIEGNAGYDKVEIDVFSGASAGSLSLAVMLRALSWRTQEEEEAAESRLANEYPVQWAKASAPQKQDLKQALIAAQVAQDLQYRAWVELVTLDQLLGGNNPERELAMKSSAGLLDSRAIHKIAQELVIPPDGSKVIWERRLLADRCLYACALTSLTPFRADGRSLFAAGNTPPPPGLEDALTSRYHNDLRVFDIHLGKPLTQDDVDEAENQAVSFVNNPQKEYPAPSYPPRWYRLHDAEKINKVGEWKARESWAEIAATAIASGAFPGAFDPVVLRRFAWEYGWEVNRMNSGNAEAESVNNKSAWPKPFQEKRIDQHPFAYIDGGVFNNEPLREAFRMASFLDCRDDPDGYQRWFLFVDPSVSPENDILQVPALREFGSGEKRWLNAWSPSSGERRPTLTRLLGLVGNLVGVLLHQGRCREADKVVAVRDNFKLRTAFRNSTAELVKTISETTAETIRAELIDGCAALLASWPEAMIPPGEGTQVGELKRVILEEHEKLYGSAANYIQFAEDYIDVGKGFLVAGISRNYQTWVWLHLAVYFDLALGLDGKRETTGLVPITPYQTAKNSQDLIPLKLLGDPMSAFAGFMSTGAREHDFKAGRYCAGLFLKRENKIPNNCAYLVNLPQKSSQDAYRQDLIDGVERLKARLTDVVNDVIAPLPAAPVLGLTGIDKILSANIEQIVEERYNPSSAPCQRMDFELFIIIPEGISLEIDGPGPRDRDSSASRVILGTTPKLALVTALSYDSQTQRWEGGALHGSQTGARIYIDKPGLSLGHWAILRVPNPQESSKLLKEAATHLRPVLVVDLEDINNRPTSANQVIGGDLWDVIENAVPLDYCLLSRC